MVQRFAPLLRQVNQLAQASALREVADKELLERFAGQRDQEAFAVLVRRHGSMVLAVCRSVLRQEQDAEDACQATFLVLARKAGSLQRPEAVGPWLHGVAYRLALRARVSQRRTEVQPGERGVSTPCCDEARPAADPAAELMLREGHALLHEELARLPARYRGPLVLYYLQGSTRAEAAQQLGCPVATLKSRLERGRKLLRTRLARRGLTLPAALSGLLLHEVAGTAWVQAGFARTTSAAAAAFAAARDDVPGVPCRVLCWAAGSLRSLTTTRLHLVTALLLALLTLGGGVTLLAGLTASPVASQSPPPEKPAAQPAEVVALASGNWVLVEWLAPNAPHGDTVLTIATKDGKPTITAVKDDGLKWQAGGLTVSGRRVTFTLTREGPVHKRFDGLIDPTDSTRVLGSLWWEGALRAERVVLELVLPGQHRKPQKPELPPEYAKFLELAIEEGNTRFAAEGPRFQAKPPAQQERLRAAAQAAQQRFWTEMPQLFRKLVAERPDTPFGYEAAMDLISKTGRLKPAASEVDTWVQAAQTFAATHGPQFEAATVGRASQVLTRYAAYADLARRYAAEADRLTKAAGMSEVYAAQAAEYDAERLAWASQPNPPAEGSVWKVTLTGQVADAQGKPIADAEVVVNNTQWVETLTSDGSYKAKTGPDGRYAITLKCRGVYRLHVTKMWVEKKGFVTAVNADRHKLLPGQSATIDFALRSGELFGGMLKIRPDRWERDRGREHKTLHLLTITGAGVNESVMARNGEKFELTLPAGSYSVELVNGRKKLSWPDLKTGRTDHVLEEPPFQFTPETVGAGFDEMWRSMDHNYSYFALKPKVDWAKLREEYRPRAVKAQSAQELAAILTEMLGHLKDGHVWIEMPDGKVIGTHRTPWTYNGNRKVILSQLTDVTEFGAYAVVGRTRPDGFGYFLMTQQSAATPELVAKAAAAIEKLTAAPGFIIDLRTANGGSEPLAQEIAQLFCAKKVVYAKSRYRNGPNHENFTADQPRELLPAKSGKPYLKPVVCLLGPGCVSSGEGFAKMLAALPHVTTVGLPTRGCSGNPGTVEVGETGISVYFSRWVDLLPDGTPIEGRGVQPAIRVDAAAVRYKDADPTLVKGLEVLRAKAAGGM